MVGMVWRGSQEWDMHYAKRMCIKRIFRSLKHSRGLEGHLVRGMVNDSYAGCAVAADLSGHRAGQAHGGRLQEYADHAGESGVVGRVGRRRVTPC